MLFPGLGVEERLGQRFRTFRCPHSHLKELVREGLQTLFAGDLCTGPPFRLEGQVEIFEFLLAGGGADRLFKLVGQQTLLGDAFENGVATILKLQEVGPPLGDQLQLFVVKAAGGFLAVASHEGDSAAVGKEGRGGAHLLRAGAGF